jgi:hypothetical protein
MRLRTVWRLASKKAGRGWEDSWANVKALGVSKRTDRLGRQPFRQRRFPDPVGADKRHHQSGRRNDPPYEPHGVKGKATPKYSRLPTNLGRAFPHRS